MGDKGSFPLMSIFNSDIIISPLDVEFGEHLSTLEFVDKVQDEGKGVCVTNGVFVDIVVVLAWAQSTILLFDKEEQ